MKHLTFFLMLGLVLLAGCSQDSLQGDALVPGEDVQTATMLRDAGDDSCPVLVENLDCTGKTKVVKFRASGTITIEEPPEGCQVLGASSRVVIEGTGNMTHLGKFTVQLTYCQGGEFPDVYPVSLPSGTVTAANGDMLYVQYTAPAEPDPSGWQHYVVMGGTGRYENACGYWDFCGGVDFENGSFSHDGLGAIRY